ncbi:MAG TPA: LacI family DNA-binding transcriptional regulator, partial [Spirochaetia bacterium]|nr:LacI family DNA-binding transcriptional regulator [Spirochaetia bacterium]
VSKSTVSRVLNKVQGVSEQARTRVSAAMNALNYKPSATARNLALKRSDTVALVVQDIRNPYASAACWYAERLLKTHGFHMVVFNGGSDSATEREILEAVVSLRAGGILCVGGNRDQTNLVNFHSKNDLPVVLIDREVRGYDIPAINLDNQAGGMCAADFLLSLGHHTILFATSDFNDAELHRRQGFYESLHKHGVPRGEGLLFTQSEEKWSQGCYEGLEPFFSGPRRPTAVFASNDLKAMHILRFLHGRGLSVPGDVSIIGFDDVSFSSLTVPSLSTVRQPLRDMMEAGVAALASLISGREVVPPLRLFQPELVQRESTHRVEQGFVMSSQRNEEEGPPVTC